MGDQTDDCHQDRYIRHLPNIVTIQQFIACLSRFAAHDPRLCWFKDKRKLDRNSRNHVDPQQLCRLQRQFFLHHDRKGNDQPFGKRCRQQKQNTLFDVVIDPASFANR